MTPGQTEFEDILGGLQVDVEGYENFDTFLDESEAMTEVQAISEADLNERLTGIENLHLVQIVALALIAGCLIATLVMRFFHVR